MEEASNGHHNVVDRVIPYVHLTVLSKKHENIRHILRINVNLNYTNSRVFYRISGYIQLG